MTQIKTTTIAMPGTLGSAKFTWKSPSMQHIKIGFIGLGFVGNAILESLKESNYDCKTVLIDPVKGFNDTYNDLSDADGVFVAVPSPMGDDGACDTSFLEAVLDNLRNINYQGVIISKCTVPPSVYETLSANMPNLVHAPEFLTAANAVRDYMNGTFSIIGGSVPAYMREAERIIRATQPSLENVRFCTIGEAALAKYTINSFLATKVAFMNEIYELASAAGLDYNKISEMVQLDKRIGNSHMQVPGPDGQFGFGGACFPKDTSALLKFAEGVGQTPMVLDAAVRKNTILRLK
jgi:UDPglucose 6-dehydrogenase